MSEHEQKSERLEAEVDEMQHRSEHLGEEISDVREDWEAKRRDESFPAARTPESGLPPEANFVSSGDDPREGDGELPPPEPDETD